MNRYYRNKVVPYDDNMTYSVAVFTVSMVTSMCNNTWNSTTSLIQGVNKHGSYGNFHSAGFKYKIYDPIL